MKITVVFDSLEEFRQHFGTTCAPTEPVKVWEPVQEPEKEPEPAEELPFKEDPKPAEKPAEAPTIDAVRKLLAELNKRAGKNVAKDLIKAIGYKKLTEVPAEKLQELAETAMEEAVKYGEE